MGIKKELSKKCGNCGVEWLSDLSNKQKGRALCNECYTIESQKHSKEQRERRAEIVIQMIKFSAKKRKMRRKVSIFTPMDSFFLV